jgi:hypothetical protein
MQFYTIGSHVYDSRVYIVDKVGQKLGETPTVFLSYVELKQYGQSDIRWKDVKGDLKEYIINAQLGTISYFNSYGYTPLTVIQE